MLNLDSHDDALLAELKQTITAAISNAHAPVAIKKKLAVFVVRLRNEGRAEAKRRHPFSGVCEASGRPLDPRLAVLDELEPHIGYKGKVRWVCPKANNSGAYSCGGC